MKHLFTYQDWSRLLESKEDGESIQQKMADLESLYSLGMIDSRELLLDRIRLRGKFGELTNLTNREVELVDPELAETLNDTVNENAFDVSYDYPFTGPEEEAAAMDFIERDQEVEIGWQVYLDGTLDASMYFPELGPDQLIRWTDSDGNPRSRSLLEYYESPLVSRLDPQATSGSIELWNFYQDLIRELFSDLIYDSALDTDWSDK